MSRATSLQLTFHANSGEGRTTFVSCCIIDPLPQVDQWGPPGSSSCSQLLGTVGAVDLLPGDDEALVGQRQRALLTGEAVLVPGEALVVHHVGAVAKTCRGGEDVMLSSG